MKSWFNIFNPKRPDESSGTTVDALTVSLASTSANVVIHDFTQKFAQDFKEIANQLDNKTK